MKKKKAFVLSVVSMFIFLTSLFTFSISTLANPNDYTVEGDMTRFATGNAYPTQIIFTGYNATTDELYLNIGLDGGTSYDYEANVYQGSDGSLWGSVTEVGITDVITPALEVTNNKITANVGGTDLEIAHRIVVTVTDYTP